MKSVKPGRGPSLLGGAASVIAAVIGVVWIAVAASMDAPVYFCLFGVVFVGLAIAHALYDLYNATAKRRFSLFDITEEGEEPDPLAREDGSGRRGGLLPRLRREGGGGRPLLPQVRTETVTDMETARSHASPGPYCFFRISRAEIRR